MKTSRSITTILVAVFTALLLAACGGGDGGDGDASGPPAAGVSITPANAELFSSTIVKSLDIVERFSNGGGILTGVSVNPAASGFNSPDLFVKQLALASQSNTGSLTGVVVPAEDFGCTDILGGISGTVTVSGDVADPTLVTVSTGDQFNLDFNACSIDGIELNGVMSLTVTTITPNFDGFPPFTLGMDTVLTDFSKNDAGFIVTGNGDMSILLDADVSGDLTLVISGTSFLTSAAGKEQRLTDFQFDIRSNKFSGDYSIDLSGSIATTAMEGSVSYVTTVVTTVPLTGNAFGNTEDPTAGEMHITTTADSSQLRITALSNGVDVMIEIDADGDSLFETTIMTTWTALSTR